MTNDILSSIQNNIYMPVFLKKEKREKWMRLHVSIVQFYVYYMNSVFY